MQLLKSSIAVFASALLLLFSAGAARAQGDFNVLFTLDAPIHANNGEEKTLSGIIQNTGADFVLINRVQIDLEGEAGTYLTPNDSIFYANVPGFFGATAPDNFYSGPIIGLLPASTTPPGVYKGSVTLLGGADEDARLTLATAHFSIRTVNAAEPNSAPLLLIALLGISLFHWKPFVLNNRHK